ncbi:MAG TPA: leucine carboxyl methyltransferase [Acinetobacter ursingii]|uniref:class I SAM-dependent methyltransferase n=1 Tax=Acinetobacter ursingii TaxID=108980 RepID=UPI000667E201|nr:class I SAM-dependent methyltransferase [Acinetobacter ursingii]MCH2005566.1 class I SAM-dependent methyltransferase [Acinetobacter ursingii]MCU4305630.1 class I SAM-dependent methyltransferase [Acinetobacter ursingii]MCU4371631.1 class I SAM-dependent methyltransferase [Acinetobacter ursingii]MCU4381699.1 class I SAM-dependent methyltransferase [Acinetobacter ursingii]MCU4608456.1 class I SAM-dependent methyltransferase [Acinetobacter ursingii]
MTQPLSKHRHISFTAHYTGYIWYQMGISHQVFATKKGKSLAALVHPLESWAEKYVGGSMRSTLKQRHTLLDDQLKTLIEQHPQLQVLEIASGLSPRGWWFRQHYPEITYRELDLPDMAQTKQAALQQIEANAPEMLSVDLFTAEFKQAFDLFDHSLPLVVISEGLINYFDKPLLAQLIQSIAEYGQPFKELHYFTDLYPEPVKNKLANIIWSSSKLLKWMSRSAFSFHFTTPADVETFFMENGFDQVKVTQPKDYFDSDTVQQQNNQEHLGDLVWTIHAINKKHT